ncbi:MAG TPA: CBS domain-containing protein [Phycisphaerae bacterium]|nr:CBS domain-containing protein [Phycisphaerae bacterium]HRW51747.1 CBS domain-containing protein [Phycisphaerae bacterium]
MSTVRNILAVKGNDVATIAHNKTAFEAAQMMHESHIGSVLVMRDGEIAGIFTERDLMNRIVAEQRDARKTQVVDVMTERIACCTPETTLDACRSAMTRNRMRHLPVLDTDGKLVGIISSGDIMARELKDTAETLQYLHDYIAGPN